MLYVGVGRMPPRERYTGQQYGFSQIGLSMPEEKESLKARLGSEMRSAFYLTLYFGVWFSALNLLVHETLGRSGLPLEAWAFAWIKAALCAKFVLVGEMLVPMPPVNRERLWVTVLPRSLVYLLVVVALNALEEGARSALHGGSLLDGVRHFAEGNHWQFVAMTWVYWLILVPYLTLERLLTAPKEG